MNHSKFSFEDAVKLKQAGEFPGITAEEIFDHLSALSTSSGNLIRLYAGMNETGKEVIGHMLSAFPLKPGYGTAYIPLNFIVINPADATSCEFAQVFEARNHECYHVPHFVCFNHQYRADDADYEAIMDFVKSYDNACAEAFTHIVEKVYENGEFVNMKEWDESFIPAIFTLPVKGSKEDLTMYHGKYPYGAYIERPEGYSFEIENHN